MYVVHTVIFPLKSLVIVARGVSMAVSAPGEAPGSVLALGTRDQRTNAIDLTISSFSSGLTDTQTVAQGEALSKQPIDPEAAQLSYCLPAEAGHLANQTLAAKTTREHILSLPPLPSLAYPATLPRRIYLVRLTSSPLPFP